MRGLETPPTPVQESDSRPPIVRAETTVTALVASCSAGPADKVVKVAGMADFAAAYGGAVDSPLGRAAAAFFDNGGGTALTVRTDVTRRALAALADSEPFQLLVIDPALLGPGDLGEADALCEERRAFLVADAAEGGAVPQELVAVGARNAAVYYPPLLDAAGAVHPVGPAVAGVFARNDRGRGVWKASAGTSASVTGAAGVAVPLSSRELDRLSGRNVNALRVMPDGVVVVWGDRTVSSDPEWKYVNTRRLILFVEHSIDEGLRWAAFEPNGETLWAEVRAQVGAFLTALWRQGAFPGDRLSEAFFVRCDASTMTEADLAAGRLVLLVGIATVRPAEFVVIQLSQRTAGGPDGPRRPR